MARTSCSRPVAGVRLAAFCGVLAVGLAACSGSSTSGNGGTKAGSTNSSGGSFTLGIPTSFLAHFIPGRTGDSNVDYAVWTPLTEIDPATGKLVNVVAQSITSTDQKTWTIKIKPGWTFQNGEPVTAQSFADSWNATAYGPNAWENNYLFASFQGYADLNPAKGKPTAKTMSGVKVVDAHTLQVTLTQPDSLFPYTLSGTPMAPMPKAAFQNLTAFDKKPISDGPFQVTGAGLTTGAQQVTLQKYANYAGRKAHADKVVLKLFQDNSSLYTNFQAHSVDIALLSGNDLANAAKANPSEVQRVTFPAVVYLGFPLWDKRFTNPKVREAISMAIDRKGIVTSLLQGFGQPANALAPSSLTGADSNDCSACTFDPAQAKQLLSQAGGWSGPLTLWTYQDPTNNVVLQAIVNQLRTNLGISNVSMQAQPVTQIYPNLSSHKINGPFLLYTGATFSHLYALSSELFTKSFLNVTGYDNAQVASLLTQAAQSGDQNKVTSLTQQATKQALSDLPIAPIYFPVGGIVHSPKLGNIHAEFLGGPALADITVGS